MHNNAETTAVPDDTDETPVQAEPKKQKLQRSLGTRDLLAETGGDLKTAPAAATLVGIQRTWLTPDKQSWIDEIKRLPPDICITSESEFNRVWALHPAKHSEVKMFGKKVPVPRWQQSYGQSYRFSGMTHEALPITDPFLLKLQQWVITNSGGLPYNQMLLNWYKDGNHYIGAHSDDESQLVPLSPIYSFSFGEERDFVVSVKTKTDPKTKAKFIPDPEVRKVAHEYPKKWVMRDNSCLIMGGRMQQKFKHAVPAIRSKKKLVGPRINVTFRLFQQPPPPSVVIVEPPPPSVV